MNSKHLLRPPYHAFILLNKEISGYQFIRTIIIKLFILSFSLFQVRLNEYINIL